MGPQQVALLEFYLKAQGQLHDFQFSKLRKNGQVFVVNTTPYGGLVAESASSATQIAIAKPSRPGMIGLSFDGKAMPTILELAKKSGRSTGLVSDTSITQATPASFVAHQIDRYAEDAIAEDIAKSNVDVLLSGGYSFFSTSGGQST